MPLLTFRYYASARAAAGTSEELVEADSVSAAVAVLLARHDDTFARVVGASSMLLDGTRLDDRDAPIRADAEVHVLPPFAGG
ncbi:MoaD/ThiS family protein [Jatrophihabitans endophyticus]|uniref:MoaD/ThiS family protein n=1 Tax=Jatrophihabitans endophyticus TaxID=1206085 RepID=UPI0019F7F3D2|nr:MoaD/ThiS family protein [Jatrophihabitans endophyticus]MBE7189455.1 MoaD/ThiS family protein [Jatrophihabitans endophyticus]